MVSHMCPPNIMYTVYLYYKPVSVCRLKSTSISNHHFFQRLQHQTPPALRILSANLGKKQWTKHVYAELPMNARRLSYNIFSHQSYIVFLDNFIEYFYYSEYDFLVAALARSSLEVCATNIKRGRTDLISVCKMHAVQCMGMSMKLAEDNSCEWPNHESTPCNKCQLWQTCNGIDVFNGISFDI